MDSAKIRNKITKDRLPDVGDCLSPETSELPRAKGPSCLFSLLSANEDR